MNTSDILSSVAIILSIASIILTFLNYNREKNKSNQDLLYQDKLNSYKELMFLANDCFAKLFDIVNKVQDNTYKKDLWEKKWHKFSGTYYSVGFNFQKHVQKNSLIIPEKIYNNLFEISNEFIGFVTSSYHCEVSITHNSYEYLSEHLFEIENMFKSDLKIDILEKGLKSRIN